METIKRNNPDTQFTPQGFVVSNPRKGRIYLCRNNCATNFECCGCGHHDNAGWPAWFFFEGDPGFPVCDECARADGFTTAPHISRWIISLLGSAIANGLRVEEPDNKGNPFEEDADERASKKGVARD